MHSAVVALPVATTHTSLLYLHPSLECIHETTEASPSADTTSETSLSSPQTDPPTTTADSPTRAPNPPPRDNQLMRSTAQIAAGSVLLIEHVVHGNERHLKAILQADPLFCAQLDPRVESLDSKYDSNSAQPQVDDANLTKKVAHNAFLGPDGSMRLGPIVTRFNHACDPDCSVRYVYEETECKHRVGHMRKDGFAVIYALRDIEAGREVCYQYNVFAHDLFQCSCGREESQRAAILARNRDVVGPPLVELNRSFIESKVARYLDDRETTCKRCGVRVTNLCKGCEAVSYCSVGCQRADWGVHKVVCKAS
ncbi:hypothetical protein HDU98_001324 [Podochytrium sp. JEL0797]|nr:hypothetical protein HDU98_001324 [Podochytrium sp. JEL0797]